MQEEFKPPLGKSIPRRIPLDGENPTADDPRALDFATLARRASVEHEHYCQGLPNHTRYAYDIFRRAFVEHDDLAWQYIYDRYRMLVTSWVQRTSAFASSSENSEYFVNAAFLRLIRAITPDKFANFQTLPSLLNYLQCCATSVVLDDVRAWSWTKILPEEAMSAKQEVQSDDVLATINAMELWQSIERLLHDETEHEVMYRSFVLWMRPAEIYAARPDLFASVNDVYVVKRNVIERLRSNPLLRQLYTQ